MTFSFTLRHQDSGSSARTGTLKTPHGSVDTPVFMPVGTRGSVKGILPDRLEQTGSRIILANTYHLLLRPGPGIVADLGGLHKFMGWKGPILTDSGGYQVFSLSSLNRIGEDEVEFASHIDGAKVRLSAKIATEVQNQLGADIIMAFDECVALPCDRKRMELAVERTLRWAEQSLEAHQRSEQWMFGIVQGGTDSQMRQYCAEELIKLNFPGYAIGGLSVGEGHDLLIETTRHTAALLPKEKPRYLMGVGTPRDLVAAIEAGVDMFDCVLPTRNGRNAFVFTKNGTLRLRNQKFQTKNSPIDANCSCYTCQNFSRGYLRHLFLVNEMAGPILVSLHNIHFFQWLMAQARQAINENRYSKWAKKWANYDQDRSAGQSHEIICVKS
jgi:queuine tRNA-ribosyltransferase